MWEEKKDRILEIKIKFHLSEILPWHNIWKSWIEYGNSSLNGTCNNVSRFVQYLNASSLQVHMISLPSSYAYQCVFLNFSPFKSTHILSPAWPLSLSVPIALAAFSIILAVKVIKINEGEHC